MNRKANLPRQYGDFLNGLLCKFDASRRVEIVQQFVAYVFQGFQSCFLGEVLDVSVELPARQEASFPEYGLYTQIQWKVKNLQIALRPNPIQKSEVVFDVLDDIEHQNQLEESALLLTNVGQFKLESFVGPALAHRDGLRRDVVSQKRQVLSILSCNSLSTSPAPHPTSQAVFGFRQSFCNMRRICLTLNGDSSVCQRGFFSRYPPSA